MSPSVDRTYGTTEEVRTGFRELTDRYRDHVYPKARHGTHCVAHFVTRWALFALFSTGHAVCTTLPA